ncbi:hypothetical protein [Mucilaginibacter ginsenosidivorans]|uniref:Uncharacterized protein n=1 Tax=Mucilaginibacter ginsenosidivorans TaxID=398053 RepID=A0A5B8UR04_9SPHI|nr:hypothetical protein [Mucilaginibacter ginsenosidivorans]QEC61419.1 hypothetical protein FRZ54_02075 [Mucilaginibacter ginsenosidivorans]
MADVMINNVDDLRAEIARLKIIKQEQGEALAERFNSPITALATVYSAFPNKRGGKNDLFQQDFVSILSRVVLPLMLNKTIFRNSGFIVKTLVSLVSQKASRFINEDSIAGLWDKVKTLFEKKDRQPDYGIPPESEAS